MAQSSIFYLPELLEQILHFLVIDKSLHLLYLLAGFGTDVVPLSYGGVLS